MGDPIVRIPNTDRYIVHSTVVEAPVFVGTIESVKNYYINKAIKRVEVDFERTRSALEEHSFTSCWFRNLDSLVINYNLNREGEELTTQQFLDKFVNGQEDGYR